MGSFRIRAGGTEARKGVCNSRAERVGVSGTMSGGLALKRHLKVLQVDAFDAGEAVGVTVWMRTKEKKAHGTRFFGRG